MVVYPVLSPDSHGSRTDSHLSIIRGWHLNLPLNLALTLLYQNP